MHKNLDSYQGDYQTLRYDANYAIVYTKTESDSLPITSTKVEKRPCLDPSKSSDFLYEGFTNQEMLNFITIEPYSFIRTKEFYSLELDRWNYNNTIEGFVFLCDKEDEFDPRY